MAVSNKGLGATILQIALALFLLFSGIKAMQVTATSNASFGQKLTAGINRATASVSGNEVVSAVDELVEDNGVATFIIIVIALCELIAGAFLIVNFFVSTGNITDLVLLIIIIVWLVILVLVDIIGKGGLFNGAFKNMSSFLSWCSSISYHLLVLGGLLVVKRG